MTNPKTGKKINPNFIGINSPTPPKIIPPTVKDPKETLDHHVKTLARVLTWWSSVSFGSLTVGGIILGGVGEFIPMKFGLIFLPVLGLVIFKSFVYFRFKNNFI